MKVKIQKHSYVLHKISGNSNTQFNLIKKNIPMSIFSIISYQFFKKMIKKKIINLFVIKIKKKISCIITVITPNDFIKLKYNICFFFLKNPLIFFLNVRRGGEVRRLRGSRGEGVATARVLPARVA